MKRRSSALCQLWLDQGRFLMLVDGEDNGHHKTLEDVAEQMRYRDLRFKETRFDMPNVDKYAQEGFPKSIQAQVTAWVRDKRSAEDLR